jgi:hypothetical protein
MWPLELLKDFHADVVMLRFPIDRFQYIKIIYITLVSILAEQLVQYVLVIKILSF